MPLTPLQTEIAQAVYDFAKGRFGTFREHAKKAEMHCRGLSPEETAAFLIEELNRVQKNTEDFNMLARMFEETAPSYFALQMWARDGFPQFNLTYDFFQAMAVTDFGDPTDEPLYMPFDSFAVSLPSTDFLGGYTHLFVSKTPRIINKGPSIVFDIYNIWVLAPVSYSSTWPVGFTRREFLEIESHTSEVADSHSLILTKMRTLLANLLTYIEASGPLPQKRRVKGAKPDEVELIHHERKLYDVGRLVKLDGSLRKALQTMGATGETWQLDKRFMVRGHPKMQVYGPGGSLRKRVYIAPYWKGPQDAIAALERTYIVDC